MKPLIGITTCSTTIGGEWSSLYPGLNMDYVFRDYVAAVEDAGGIPIVIPVLKNLEILEDILGRIEGLILTGGDDITPMFYKEEPIEKISECVNEIDRLEMKAVEVAKERGLPALGICRGIQMFAVAFGGTLYQDIFSQLEGCLGHVQKSDKSVLTHQVKIESPSKLFNILGSEYISVNSHHHQAIKTLPEDFKGVAYAKDGIVEAIEHVSHPFLIGVQWHPEGTWQYDLPSRSLFAALVDAAGIQNRQ